MSWRTIVIENPSKLTLLSEYLVVTGENIRRIHLSEIDTIIIENRQVTITVPLINELVSNSINVLICDSFHNPFSQIISIYGNYQQSLNVSKQLKWNDKTVGEVWKSIVSLKIENQLTNVKMLSPNKEVENNMCMHLDSITSHDSTNREGMSAKIYFKQIFGKEFVREEDNEINWKLNYAYSILLSMFNRSIISKGYLLEIGIFHKGQQNNFNLSCDLIEPFRPIVDYFVIAEFIDRKFDRDCRMDMINIFNNKIKINNKRHYFTNAVEIYLQSVFDKLNEEASCIYKPEICFEL